MSTKRRVGRYTKYETAELTRMFGEGYSVYKICRNLNRSQNSIRNNLIRLGLIEGEITPRQYKPEVHEIEKNQHLLIKLINFLFYISFLSVLIFLMVIKPILNPVEMVIVGWFEIFIFLFF